MKNKVILIGYRACGKTTIGRELAKRLNWEFFDLDDVIQKKEGKSISEMVKTFGWEYFRKLEKETLKEFVGKKEVVLAPGGGAVMHEDIMKELKAESFVVWLWAPVEVILERLAKDTKTASQRPSLTNLGLKKEVEEVLKKRTPLYEKFSHIKVDTASLSVEEAVSEILKEFRQ